EIDYDVSHLNMNIIKMEIIEEIISSQYREARYKTTKKIQSALFDTLASVIDSYDDIKYEKYVIDELVEYLKIYRERIRMSLDNGETNAFMKSVLSALDGYCDDKYDAHSNKPIIIKLFQNIIRELKEEDQTLNGINIIISTFNNLLEGGKKLVVDERRSSYIEIDGERHGISDLSSGERHILTFLTLVSTVGQNRDFLIIDEPEISLNVKWQRIIIPTIKDILPNCQIIVASHSPFLSQDPNILCPLTTGRLDVK
ncbi:AAA family ATPase, partial [Gluconobacter oxydans]|uniref:AAA family ATPase n=1 Tax=Gluconobacter oxydans TaxID=442 RepID=UPI0039EA5A01